MKKTIFILILCLMAQLPVIAQNSANSNDNQSGTKRTLTDKERQKLQEDVLSLAKYKRTVGAQPSCPYVKEISQKGIKPNGSSILLNELLFPFTSNVYNGDWSKFNLPDKCTLYDYLSRPVVVEGDSVRIHYGTEVITRKIRAPRGLALYLQYGHNGGDDDVVEDGDPRSHKGHVSLDGLCRQGMPVLYDIGNFSTKQEYVILSENPIPNSEITPRTVLFKNKEGEEREYKIPQPMAKVYRAAIVSVGFSFSGDKNHQSTLSVEREILGYFDIAYFGINKDFVAVLNTYTPSTSAPYYTAPDAETKNEEYYNLAFNWLTSDLVSKGIENEYNRFSASLDKDLVKELAKNGDGFEFKGKYYTSFDPIEQMIKEKESDFGKRMKFFPYFLSKECGVDRLNTIVNVLGEKENTEYIENRYFYHTDNFIVIDYGHVYNARKYSKFLRNETYSMKYRDIPYFGGGKLALEIFDRDNRDSKSKDNYPYGDYYLNEYRSVAFKDLEFYNGYDMSVWTLLGMLHEFVPNSGPGIDNTRDKIRKNTYLVFQSKDDPTIVVLGNPQASFGYYTSNKSFYPSYSALLTEKDDYPYKDFIAGEFFLKKPFDYLKSIENQQVKIYDWYRFRRNESALVFGPAKFTGKINMNKHTLCAEFVNNKGEKKEIPIFTNKHNHSGFVTIWSNDKYNMEYNTEAEYYIAPASEKSTKEKEEDKIAGVRQGGIQQFINKVFTKSQVGMSWKQFMQIFDTYMAEAVINHMTKEDLNKIFDASDLTTDRYGDKVQTVRLGNITYTFKNDILWRIDKK